MIPLSLDEAFQRAGATWTAGSLKETCLSVSTDSRSAAPGSLFIGLGGARFDGAAFADAAAARGSLGVLCEDGPGVRQSLAGLCSSRGIAVGTVPSALDALQALGSHMRDRVTASVIGITGSCGKTSTKELLQVAMSADRRSVASPASFNNHIGVPHTLLLAAEDTRSLIVEIGTNHPGEVAHLAGLARPDVAVITNVGRSHLEGLGSIEGVEREKGALLDGLRPGAGRGAVLSLDCPRTPGLLERVPAGVRVLTQSALGATGADLGAEDVTSGPGGTAFRLRADRSRVDGLAVLHGRRVNLPLVGTHVVPNALAALGAAALVGADLQRAADALAGAKAAPHRMEQHVAGDRVVLDDAYNANPESMAAALDLLAAYGAEQPSPADGARRRVLVVGRMGELGADSSRLHRELGARIAGLGLDRVVVVGASGPGTCLGALIDGALDGGHPARDLVRAGTPAGADAAARVSGPSVVLVKASRSARLERVVQSLLQDRALVGTIDQGANA